MLQYTKPKRQSNSLFCTRFHLISALFHLMRLKATDYIQMHTHTNMLTEYFKRGFNLRNANCHLIQSYAENADKHLQFEKVENAELK